MKKRIIHLLAVFFLCSASANAAVLLNDNFNTEQFGLNYELNYNLDNWSVTNGTIDVIGSGASGSGWEYFNGANGYYLDLDGSTSNAGTVTSDMIFGPGTYLITYDLAGSRRGDVNTLDIIFGLFTSTVTMRSNDGWTTYVNTVTLSQASRLVFDHKGGDNVGLLLDNVKVENAPVPEPATMFLLGTGLAGLAGLKRRKK